MECRINLLEEGAKFWGELTRFDCLLDHLRAVEIIGLGMLLDLEFMKCMLSNAPILEKMIIYTNEFVEAEEVLRILMELLQFQRAFAQARIIYLGHYKPSHYSFIEKILCFLNLSVAFDVTVAVRLLLLRRQVQIKNRVLVLLLIVLIVLLLILLLVVILLIFLVVFLLLVPSTRPSACISLYFILRDPAVLSLNSAEIWPQALT